MEAIEPPPIGPSAHSKLDELRERLAFDLDRQHDFADDDTASQFLRRCDRMIRSIQREYMRAHSRLLDSEREDVAEFLERVREHLQPLREHLRQAGGASAREPLGSDGLGNATAGGGEDLVALQRAEQKARERAQAELERHRREQLDTETAILAARQQQKLHRKLAEREATLRLVQQMSDVSPDEKRGLEREIRQLRTDLGDLVTSSSSPGVSAEGGEADDASLRLARELQRESDRAVAAQIAAEEYSDDRPYRELPTAGGGGGARVNPMHQLSQMSQMLDMVGDRIESLRGFGGGSEMGWQAQMLGHMATGGTAPARRGTSACGLGAWWEYEDEGQWRSYDGFSASLLESGFLALTSAQSPAGLLDAAHSAAVGHVQVAGGHIVDLASMQQHDAMTGLVHNLRRREVLDHDPGSPLRAVRRPMRGARIHHPVVPENATYEQLLELDEQGSGRAAGGIQLAQLDQLTALQTLGVEQLQVLEKNDDAECKICLETYSTNDQLRRLVRTLSDGDFSLRMIVRARSHLSLGSHQTQLSLAVCSLQPCQHLFHKECVDQHFTVGGKSNCPVCRHDLRG